MTQADHSPDVEWLATAEAVQLEAEIDRASAALRGLTGDDPTAALAGVTNVLRRTLENGSELDPLPPAKARPLVLAALVFVRNNKDLVAASGDETGTFAVLRRLHHRRAEFGNPAIQKNLDELAKQFELTPQELEQPKLSAPPPADTGSSDEQPSSRPDPLEDWLGERETLQAEARVRGDVKLLNTYAGRPIPTVFAEVLYGDDEVWAEPALERWLDDQGEPFDAARNGVAAAALLNARVRTIRPRFFLRNPSSLVVQPIANTAEMEELRNEVRNDFVLRALGTVFEARAVLEAERRRGPKATVRKTEVLNVSDTLKAMFVRLGFDERPEHGTPTEFDPIDHQGAADLTSQEPVTVARPGLWDLTAQRYVIKPIVRRPDEQSDDESSDPDNPEEPGAVL